MSDPSPTAVVERNTAESLSGPVRWKPGRDSAPVLAALNKLTVLVNNAIAKDAAQDEMAEDMSHDEDHEWLIDISQPRWGDVRDVLEELSSAVAERH